MINKSPSILIVDDEKDLRQILEMEFQFRDCKIYLASNGKEALEIVSSEQIDIILSDVQMPVCSGIDFVKNIPEQEPKPKIYFMSGFSEVTEDQIKSLGIIKMFKKPFNLAEMADEILEN